MSQHCLQGLPSHLPNVPNHYSTPPRFFSTAVTHCTRIRIKFQFLHMMFNTITKNGQTQSSLRCVENHAKDRNYYCVHQLQYLTAVKTHFAGNEKSGWHCTLTRQLCTWISWVLLSSLFAACTMFFNNCCHILYLIIWCFQHIAKHCQTAISSVWRDLFKGSGVKSWTNIGMQGTPFDSFRNKKSNKKTVSKHLTTNGNTVACLNFVPSQLSKRNP